MKSRRDQVRAAIRMRHPDYVPLYFVNRDKEQSDIIMVDVVRHFMGPKRDISEWGFFWDRTDETMGQPRDSLVKEWDQLEALRVPDPADPARYADIAPAHALYGERYYIASLVLSGFTMMSFLRGFAPLLTDLYTDRTMAEKLAQMVFGFEEGIIERLPGHGIDAVSFYDDWGTQSGLIISPRMWRDFFKPLYKRQFALAHSAGLDVYFHSCGAVAEIIPDLIEIGVDMLNLGQPNLFDIAELGRSFGGRVCFVCPVSYQTTSISGTPDQIREVVRGYRNHLGRFGGGLIGYVEEYHSLGLSEENYQACISAFRGLQA